VGSPPRHTAVAQAASVRGEIGTVETLLYVRHGTSEFNLERRFGGSTDTPLAPQGYEEARIAAEVAAGVTIDCIVSSPLSRCRRTAEIIAERIGFPIERIIVNELLVERGFGPLEGTPLRPEAEIENEPGVETTDALLGRAWTGARMSLEHRREAHFGVWSRSVRRSAPKYVPPGAPHRCAKRGQSPPTGHPRTRSSPVGTELASAVTI
jgi:hypothetical protein